MKTLQGNARKAVQLALALPALGSLAVPLLVVSTSGFADHRTAIRLTALYALTLVFINVVTGSFRPLLAGAFKPKTLFKVHNYTGVAGFSLALTHGILIIVYGIWPGFTKLGPVAFYLLALTTSTALGRKFLKKGWRQIHRLNYVVLAVALVHAFQVGSDLLGGGALEVIFIVYAAVASAGFIYRLQEMIRRYWKKQRAGA